jgi:hypothetical protein
MPQMKKTDAEWAAEAEAESKARIAAQRRANYPDETATLPAGQVPRLPGGPWSSGDGFGVEPPVGE